MFNKIVSLVLTFIFLINNVFAQRPDSVSNFIHSESPVENIFNFKPTVIAPEEDLTSDLGILNFNMIFFAYDIVPFSIVKSDIEGEKPFIVSEEGLFCMNVNDYTNMVTKIKTNSFNEKSITKSERKKCSKQKERNRKQAKKIEDKLHAKIKKLENDLREKDKKYDSLESKVLWIQLGAGAAVLAISGFAIYSSQN